VIDFHCHLDLYPDPTSVARQIGEKRVGALSVTTTPSAWRGTSALAKRFDGIRTAVGLHPQLAGERAHELAQFDQILPTTGFVGEVGLDGSPKSMPPWERQLVVFEHILRSCSDAGGRVLSLHSRSAATAVLDSLDRYPHAGTPILHWFSGSLSELSRAVDRGMWFSVGSAMLQGAKGRRLVKSMPRSRVLLETDGPFTTVGTKVSHPWDISDAITLLANEWECTRREAGEIVQRNERELIETLHASFR
jgi:TatD DNase family protein